MTQQKWIADGVNPARDAFEKYVNKPFEITQTDIDNATRENSLKCVLAASLNNFFNGEFSNIMIHPNCATIGFDDTLQWCFYGFSKEVRKYIQAFDDGKSVNPVTLCFRYTGSNKYNSELCMWYPKGWDARRVQDVKDYYENQIESEATEHEKSQKN